MLFTWEQNNEQLNGEASLKGGQSFTEVKKLPSSTLSQYFISVSVFPSRDQCRGIRRRQNCNGNDNDKNQWFDWLNEEK